MNNTKAHQKLVDDILFAFGSKPDVRVWKRVVGFDDEKMILYGIPGESDIQGIVAPHGRFLAIEVKTGKGVLSEKQKLWRDMILKFGGIYIEARDVVNSLAEFERQL